MSDSAQSEQDSERWDAAQVGADLLTEGLADEAARELEALVARDPDNEYAWFFLGSVRYEQERYADAMRAYVRALECKPEYPGAMLHLGHTMRMLGHHAHAIRLGKQLLARDAEDPDALYLLGTASFAHGDDAAARGYLERFVATRPEPEAMIEATGMLQVLRGEVLQATPSDDPD